MRDNDAWMEGLAPEPELTVDEWADTHRILSSVASAEPGRWSTARTPYLRDIMRELSAKSRTEKVVFMKGAQLGGTEVGLNWIGYVVQHVPGPMLMVQPTVETAKRVSKQRVDALIEASHELSDRISDPRSRDSGNTILMKEFPGGVLILTGANSAVGLRSMPVRFLFLDEVDGYPADAAGEGDPVGLAIQRSATFNNRKIFMCSTPTVKDASRIEAAYEESDKRIYMVPCDGCGKFSRIMWKDIRWPEGKPEEAAWVCPECGTVHHEFRKPALLAKGRWVATAVSSTNTAGFHLSSLYSPWLTWAEIAQEHLAAKDDPVRLKVWVNTKLAETWEETDGEGIDENGLMERREHFGPKVPASVAVLTCGVDVQDNRLELELVGWGRDEESWSCDYRVIWGDPSAQQVWDDLEDYLSRTFFHEALQDGLPIMGSCIDTGGHHTQAAYAFCAGKERKRIWAVKGVSAANGSSRPIWPKRPTKAAKGKVNLFTIGVDAAKEAIYGRLKVTESGAGCCHFPMDRDVSYFEQLTAEKLRTKYNGGFARHYWWKPDGKRNEALDCRVYAYAALHGLFSMGLNLNRRADALPSKEEEKAPAQKIPRRRMVVGSRYV